MIPCRFHAQGRCRNGSSCRFSHAEANPSQTPPQQAAVVSPRSDTTEPSPTSQSSDTTTQTDPRSGIPCRFFLQGACYNGDQCLFAHDDQQNVAEPAGQAQARSRPDTWRRELRGAMVSFGDGAVVAKVSFPSDFSAVRINPLPRDSSVSSIVVTLASLGFVVPEDCVRILPSDDNSSRTAEIRVEDSTFAKRLRALLPDEKHGALTAVPVNVTMPQTTNHRRVDSKKVHCSWHQPTKTAWLNFGNRAVAAKVGSRFSAGIYTVLNQHVRCGEPTRGRGARNPQAWTIMLPDVPPLAEEEDLTKDIPPKLLPRHIELGAASYDTDLPTANASVESLLLQAGQLESWEGGSDVTGKRFKAKARFLSDADARQAVALFHNKTLPFHKNGKLTVVLVHSARLKISNRVYFAIEREIAARKPGWRERHLRYTAYPPAHGLRVLKIEGDVAKDVANAKAELEKILDGEVVMKDGKAVWVSSFAANGSAYQKMKKLERDLGIVIARDRRRTELRLVGPKSQFEKAQAALIKLAEANSSPVFAIELDAEQFSHAFNGGYRAIEAAIGDDKVSLDIVSNPRRILVAGSEADFILAQEILKGGGKESVTTPEADSVSNCAICWTEAENPVHTECEHVYCAGCFEDLCRIGAGSDTGKGIRCQGDGGECATVLALTELQAHLSSAALEDVLETAFASYVTRNPADLRNCPTPDCGQMYRAAAKPTSGDDDDDGQSGRGPPLFTCPACLTAVCMACDAEHEGLTCAEYRDLGSEGHEAIRKAKEALGIKDCPNCGVGIEKTEGCNHMSCRCGAHICWVCMKAFPSSQPVYQHMDKEHGGNGLEDLADAVAELVLEDDEEEMELVLMDDEEMVYSDVEWDG